MSLNRKNKITLILVFVIACTACVVWVSNSKKSTLNQDFYVKDIQSVTKIYMVDKQNSDVLLEKQNDSVWLVDGENDANMPLVSLLLETLNTMRISYPVSKKQIPTVIKVLSIGSIKVEVYQKVYAINLFDKIKLFPREKLTKEYYVGHETRDNMGTHMILKGDETPYIIHIPGFRGYLTPRFETGLSYWKSRKIFDHNAHAIQTIKVEIPNNEKESFEVVKDGDSFHLKQLSTGTILPAFDTLRMAQLLSSFVNVNFDEFVSAIPSLQIDSVFSRNPEFIITVTDTANHSKAIKTYMKLIEEDTDPEELQANNALKDAFDVNRMYAVINNKDTVFIQYFIFDNILHPLSFYLQPKP